jgi:cytosine/adenosine deaminase-related metal-dependent hydrolase
VAELVEGSAACRRLARAQGARVVDLGDVALLPGLVNAHAHLELTGLAGRLPRGDGFAAWVGALLRAKAERSVSTLAEDARRGLESALHAGTTTLGDIASTSATLGAVGALGRAVRPRVRLFREVLDAWDPARTDAALELIRAPLRETSRLFEGYSPHAPFTVSRGLLAGLRRLSQKRPRPLSIHWAETQAELDWMRDGSGAFQAVLGSSPRGAGLDLLEEAGLLGETTSLVHGNLPARGEPERIASAGASLVHCPGTHAFFGRGDFPLARYQAAGVPLALGTDSLASNDSLDLTLEGQRLLEREPSLRPARVLQFATEGSARALALEQQVGRLEPGFLADAVILPLEGAAALGCADDLAEALFRRPRGPGSKMTHGLAVLVGGAAPHGPLVGRIDRASGDACLYGQVLFP